MKLQNIALLIKELSYDEITSMADWIAGVQSDRAEDISTASLRDLINDWADMQLNDEEAA